MSVAVATAGPGLPALRWLIAAMALATLPFLPLLPIWLGPTVVGIALWRLHRERHGRPSLAVIPRVTISAAMVAALFWSGGIGFGIDSAVPLFTAFLWMKLLEVRGERDVLIGCYLSAFLAVAAVLTEQGILRMAYATLTLLTVVVAALRFHVRGGARGRPTALARRALLLAAQAAPVAAVLFLLLPRPAINLPMDRGRGSSGVTDRLRPGEIASVALNQAVAFRATLSTGQPTDPEELYWRGVALTRALGDGWYPDYRDGQGARLDAAYAAPIPGGGDDLTEQDIVLMPHSQHWLYALDTPQAWPQGVRARSGFQLMREQPVASPLAYRVTSRTGWAPADADHRSLARLAAQLPSVVDPRVRALAAEWRTTAGDGGTPALIEAASRWLVANGFTYTLEPGRIDGDLVAGFLFERRAGFCGHYASAVGVVMRCAGVPTRVMIGYRGGEWNEPGGFLVVRQAHAHAWLELWDDEAGRWVRYDPTAAISAGSLRQLASDGAAALTGDADRWPRLKRWRQRWDWIDASWQNLLYRFDAEAQQKLAEKLGLGPDLLLRALAAVIGALLAVLVVALLLRRRRPRRDPARVLYDRWCARLARDGCVRAPHEGPLAFAERARAILPGRADEIAAVTAAYVAARYAGDAAALPALRRAVG